jgi:hypothetical protein
MSVTSSVSNSYKCEACDTTYASKGILNTHLVTDTHIRNAFLKLNRDEADKQFRGAIKKADEKVAKAVEELAKTREEKVKETKKLVEMTEKFNSLLVDDLAVKSERDIIKEERDALTAKLNELTLENESLKKERVERDDDASSINTSSQGYTFNNYTPLHKKYRGLLENLLGARPYRYVPKGDTHYAEFNTLRSVFCSSYNSIKIMKPHATTGNQSRRLTLGLPTLSLIDSDCGSTLVPYYIKYHIYLNAEDKATSLCSYDGVREYLLVKYM